MLKTSGKAFILQPKSEHCNSFIQSETPIRHPLQVPLIIIYRN